jgi:CRISPR/Cas system CSM-associated protein Csm3 (group 7 of RAMP superfamily)
VQRKRGAVFRADLSMKGGDVWKDPYPEHISGAFITQKYENGEEIVLQFEALEDLPDNPNQSVVYRIFLEHKIIGRDVATTNAYKQTAFEKYGRPDSSDERTYSYEYEWGIPVNRNKRSINYQTNPYTLLKAKLGNRYGEVKLVLSQGYKYYQRHQKIKEDFIRNIRLRNPNVDF